jgi:hypothetical protein
VAEFSQVVDPLGSLFLSKNSRLAAWCCMPILRQRSLCYSAPPPAGEGNWDTRPICYSAPPLAGELSRSD